MIEQTIQQQPVPNDLIGHLRETSALDASNIRQNLIRDGYVFLRDTLDAGKILAAREEVFERLESVGEIASPAHEGIATGQSQRVQLQSDLGSFWRSVSTGPLLRDVTHGAEVGKLLETIFEQPSKAHDLMYLRPVALTQSTRLHYDYPFFAGDATRILTVWIPLGDVTTDEGPLAIVEGSNHFDDLLDPIRNVDFSSDRSNEAVQAAAYEKQNEADPVTMLQQRGSKFLTSQFKAGDVLIFEGFTMHGSFDNQSKHERVRLSVDVRYQPACDPATDTRYFGDNPTGSKGGGYGDMRGAQPLF
jgi:ectoine hydroxylase-related dioxygenase (phytanoyl-CoA dioxygenase family)